MRKKVLITGGSRGIGEAAAKVLAGEGYDLFLVCKNSEEKIKKLADALEQTHGISCQTAICDV